MSEQKNNITAKTGLIAVIGDPIRHSKSPAIHNESFMQLGLDYVDIAVMANHENIKEVTNGLKAIGARGWNITMPVKEDTMKLCDKLLPAGELCGAVNTVINDNGVLTGTSTDGIGFMQSIKDGGIDPIGKKVVMIGCGGAATSILVQAALDGVEEITVFNRKDSFYEQAIQKIEKINAKTNCKITLNDLDDHDLLKVKLDEAYLLINATNVGMGKLEGLMPIPDESYLREELMVADVIYSPRVTKLCETAKKVGCKVVMNGEGMLLYQAAASFKYWFNQDMPIEHLKEILNVHPVL